jgi:hypothetical protein
MRNIRWLGHVLFLAAAGLLTATSASAANGHKLLGWNDLGMHCMDADCSVFSILPPFNNLHAQLVAALRGAAAPAQRGRAQAPRRRAGLPDQSLGGDRMNATAFSSVS